MGTIFVASRSAFISGQPYQHTFLVYDPNGDPTSLFGQQIISLQKGEDYPQIEAGRPILISSESDSINLDPYGDLNFTTVESGASTILLWNEMVQIARSLGQETDDPRRPGEKMYVPEHTYNLDYNDCHTLTNTVLELSGKGGLKANLPKIGGDTGSGEHFGIWRFPGGDGILGNNQNSTADLTPTQQESILDQGGDDTYVIDAGENGRRDGPLITIVEDSDLGTADKIVLNNVNAEDLRFFRVGNDLYIYFPGDNKPDIRILGQFEDGGAKIPSLFVYPPGGGSPVVIPMNDPDDFPIWNGPHNLPEGMLSPANQFNHGPSGLSPLVLDLDGDGVEVTRLGFGESAATTYFDMDNDGFAERTA